MLDNRKQIKEKSNMIMQEIKWTGLLSQNYHRPLVSTM